MPKQPDSMVTGRVVNKKVFDTLVSRVGAMNSKMATQRGEIGSFIKDAEETHGIHRGAFKLVLKLDGMEDLKAKDFLRSFDLYREYLKLDQRGTSDLLENDAGDDEGDDVGDADATDADAADEWDASAPAAASDDEVLAPGTVRVGGEVVKLGPKPRERRLMEAAAKMDDGSTTDPEEMGRRLAGNPLDDLTGRRH
ncbi:hypothetical protein [Ancylobacter sp.]|uniref:hypothetical protein n=1 Tax=Ancylobacter sp. TaxID=1872567 RepID=UPI003D0F629A